MLDAVKKVEFVPVMRDSSGFEGEISDKALNESVHCSLTPFSFNQTVKIKTSHRATSDRLCLIAEGWQFLPSLTLSVGPTGRDPRAQSDHTGRLKEGRCGFAPAVIDLCHPPGGALAVWHFHPLSKQPHFLDQIVLWSPLKMRLWTQR